VNNRTYLLRVFFVFVFLLMISGLKAQIVDADTIAAVEQIKDVDNEVVHSPRKATIYSAILPGLGQAYNKKYWKIPLIYIGFGTIGYFVHWNNDKYQLFRTGYVHLTDGNPETQDYLKIEAVRRNNYNLDDPNQFNNLRTGLVRQQDYFRRNRDLLIISILGFYGLNIIDASVDAHLFDFDISDDLTMNWSPSLVNMDKNMVYSINIRFNF
jgi:hypothetical protein